MLIINGHVYAQTQDIDPGYVLVEGEKIITVGAMGDEPKEYQGTILDARGLKVIPGFIDQHIHGAYNCDFMDASLQGIRDIASALPREGTTSFLATTMTQSTDAIDQALIQIVAAMEDTMVSGAELIGIHLEGPFISSKHAGAQQPQFIQKPTLDAFDHFWNISQQNIKLMTYAVEETDEEFTRTIHDRGVVCSNGHTDATYAQTIQHVKHGLRNLTHFHNAMTPHHHRHPGVVTAGLSCDQLKTELIVDGIHVHPDAITATYRIKGAANIIVITDSMRAKGLDDGIYDLGGSAVQKKGMECRLGDGTLAGSAAEMNRSVSNLKHFTGCSFLELIAMSSANSAKQLGIFDRKGSLSAGKDADIVIVNDDIEIAATICRGSLVYQNQL